MEKLNATQILEIIKNNFSEADFAFNEWCDGDVEGVPSFDDEQKAKDDYYNTIRETRTEEELEKWRSMPSVWELREAWILDHLGLGKVVEVDQYGGEGQGDTWYSVKHFVDHDVYIKITGHYQSYNGTDFYNGYGCEVRPQEKVITVFE